MIALPEAFILILGIITPTTSLSAFLSMTKDSNDREKHSIAIKAVVVAAVVFLIFLLGGDVILGALGVTLNSFRAAGGIVLLLLGIQMTLGISLGKEKKETKETGIAVVIGTPFITGPATITTTIILTKELGMIPTFLAGASALFVTFLVLFFSNYINRLIGREGIQMLSTMMGIITMAWGIQFLLGGLAA